MFMFVLPTKLEDRPQFWSASFKVWNAQRKPRGQQEHNLQQKMDIQSGEGRHNSLQRINYLQRKGVNSPRHPWRAKS